MNNPEPTLNTRQIVEKSLKKRYRAEKRFKTYGLISIFFGVFCLFLLFSDIIKKGWPAFQQTYIQIEVVFDSNTLGIDDITDEEQINYANYLAIIKQSLRQSFPEVIAKTEQRKLYSLMSTYAELQLKQTLEKNPELLNQSRSIWLLADDKVDTVNKGFLGREIPEQERPLDNQTLDWIDQFKADGKIRKQFNHLFFTRAASQNPEHAGILGAVMGSLLTLFICLVISFPISVSTAIYLEEFAPKNKWTDLIEVNINNLAAVPSIIFGLLGLAIFLNFFSLPRSAPLVGGLVLSLMTLPTIIISSRVAIKAVPPSIRQAALGLGASKTQTVMHHVLPLALPGMLTGTIIGMAQALGETAPLLMIGMVAFIADVPTDVIDPATVLPVQIYLWADSPERAFVERTSAAIMVLLGFLILMNTAAVFLRKKLERRW